MSTAELYERMAELAREGQAVRRGDDHRRRGLEPARGRGPRCWSCKDGETVETIGGGPLERQVMSDALGLSRRRHIAHRALRVARGGRARPRRALRRRGDRLPRGARAGAHAPHRRRRPRGPRARARGRAARVPGGGPRSAAGTADPRALPRRRRAGLRRSRAGAGCGPHRCIHARRHRHVTAIVQDKEALRAVVASAAASIGMMGSAKKVRTDLLGAEAKRVCPTRRSTRVHAPIGLDIGAETPAELALCIMAEIVADRHGRAGGRMELPPAAASGRRQGRRCDVTRRRDRRGTRRRSRSSRAPATSRPAWRCASTGPASPSS